MKFTFKLIWEFILRFRGILAIGIVLGVVFFIVLKFVTPLFVGRETDKIGITGRFTPDDLPGIVLRDIGDGLTRIDETGAAVASIAESWEDKNDGKTWIFHLAKGKKWQDGTEVTADSIKYNFTDVNIKTIDKYTVQFELKAAFSPFPTVVSKPAFKKGLLGTGKWKVANLSLAGAYVEAITLKDDGGNQKIYKFYPTEDRTKIAYKLGEVNKLIDLIDPKPFDTWNNTKIEKEVSKQRFVAIFFNTQDKLLSDKAVRQALSYSINKSKFESERAYSPISPDSWAYNPQVKSYDYDPKKAKDMISELSQEEKNMLTINLSTPATLLADANQIQKDWQAIGVKVNIQVVPTKPEDYQAFLIIHDIPSDPDQYAMWHSTEVVTNISKYKSARIDKLLEEGRLELNSDNRKKIYLDFQRFLNEDAPAAFLYHPISYTIARK